MGITRGRFGRHRLTDVAAAAARARKAHQELAALGTELRGVGWGVWHAYIEVALVFFLDCDRSSRLGRARWEVEERHGNALQLKFR